jgi:hypothetical protein
MILYEKKSWSAQSLAEEDDAIDILGELKKLINRLNEEQIEYALCDGLAMAVYALPRDTLEIDIMIEAISLETTQRAVHALGFTLNADPMEFHGGKVYIQRISKIEPGTGEALVLDLLIATPAIKDALGQPHESGIGTWCPQRCLRKA